MPAYEVVKSPSGEQYIASTPSESTIGSIQDFLELLALGLENKTSLFLLTDSDMAAVFYDLKSGLAGAILQKVSVYSARLAIVGSFEDAGSQRFRELVNECNKGTQVRFSRSRDEALSWLVGSSPEGTICSREKGDARSRKGRKNPG